jgi:general secretion pathway protein K
VAASAAAMMLSQHSAMLDQTLLVSARAQADQYATAGLDWARGVLTQDARSSTVDTLDEGWAQPIVGMPIERAVVAGAIADEQGKFNLQQPVEFNKSVKDVAVFRRSCAAGPEPRARRCGRGLIDSNASDAYYLALPRPYRSARAQQYATVDELYRVRGFDARTVEKLRPYGTAIPTPGHKKVNGNTRATWCSRRCSRTGSREARPDHRRAPREALR